MLKQIAKGLDVREAPSGAFSRLLRKSDGLTLAWWVPLKRGGARLDLIADPKGAPKDLLAGTWKGSGGRPQLRVDDSNAGQAERLLAWLRDNAAPKTAAVKPSAAKEKPSATKAKRRKTTAVVEKRRVRFRTPTGDIRTEDIPAAEADAFVDGLVKEGHEILGQQTTPKARPRKRNGDVEAHRVA